jgi:predicted flap endonuclease-1-like 5' DNA nuclease
MVFWLGLVAGLMIGWLVEWIIDWRFWRRDLYTSLDLERQWRKELSAAQKEIRQLQAQLTEHAGSSGDAVDDEIHRDPLEQIDGIDPAFEQRLNEAGIFTFAQLSTASAEQVAELVQPEAWQRIDPEAWIEQAKQLMQPSDQTNSSSA